MFKDPHSEFNKTLQNIFLLGALVISKVKYFAHLAEGLGRSLEILRIYKPDDSAPKPKTKRYFLGLRREVLWETSLRILSESEWVGFEFGVAWGYSTNFHVLRSKNLIAWHAFDTFTGLPESWRSYSIGHFSNNGEFPAIADKRVKWHKGLIQATLSSQLVADCGNSRKYFIFDLDLFYPTLHALKTITPFLNAGDLLYFDEPNDIDEGSLLYLFIKLNEGKVRVVSRTPCQVLLEAVASDLSFSV